MLGNQQHQMLHIFLFFEEDKKYYKNNTITESPYMPELKICDYFI
jgi:hypothetical protein